MVPRACLLLLLAPSVLGLDRLETLENLVVELSRRLEAAEAKLDGQQQSRRSLASEGTGSPVEGRRLSEPNSEATLQLGDAALTSSGDGALDIYQSGGGAMSVTIAGSVQVDGAITELRNGTRPRDCQALRDAGQTENGHYYIWPRGSASGRVEVFCEFVGADGWMVVLGGENRVDHCSLIESDCDEAATGYSDSTQFRGSHMLALSSSAGGATTFNPSSPKFCCNASMAIADQTSYHQKRCGASGGYNNRHVVFCIERSWLGGLPLGSVRVMSIHTSTAGQPWGTVFRDTRGNRVGGWNTEIQAYDIPGDGAFHTMDVSALGDAKATWTSSGGPGRVELRYLAFKLR